MGKTLIILMGGDLFIALMAHRLGVLLRVGGAATDADLRANLIRVVVFAIVLVFTTYFTELYSYERRYGVKESFLRVLMSLVLAFFILSTIYYLKPTLTIRLVPLVTSLGLFGIVQFLWHNRYPFLLRVPGIAQKVFVFGIGPLAQKMEMVLAMSNNAYTFAGFVEPASDLNTVPQENIVANTATLLEAAQRENVSKIVISLSERRGVLPVQAILGCKLQGIEVVDAQTFYEDITGKLMIEEINPSWFIFSDGFHVTPFMRFYKRIFDILLSALGLLLLLPIFPLIVLAIKLDSPGPVFFKQLRIGKGEERFHVYKFRTMRQDAERESGAVWALKNDPRVTRLGRILRKTRLDETPQLFNVLRGDMSFIGPRPERPEFVSMLNERVSYYSNRHCVKPGITGWAQVKYPYGASEDDALEKLRYDLYYIKNYSILLDLIIILETVKVVVFGRGGR